MTKNNETVTAAPTSRSHMLTIVGLTIVAVVCLAIGGALAWRQIDIPDFLGITIGTSVGALAGVLASK